MNNSRENRQVPYILTSKSRYPQLLNHESDGLLAHFGPEVLTSDEAILFKPNQQKVCHDLTSFLWGLPVGEVGFMIIS